MTVEEILNAAQTLSSEERKQLTHELFAQSNSTTDSASQRLNSELFSDLFFRFGVGKLVGDRVRGRTISREAERFGQTQDLTDN